MFDTIILVIQIDKSHIIAPSKFMPSAEGIFESGNWYSKCVQYANVANGGKEAYRPRLTLYRRSYDVFLKVEFSAPKLVFGDNLNELRESDFPQVLMKLQTALIAMGVRLPLGLLVNAPVSAFHPSKNIPLTQGYTAIFAIRELAKIDVSQKFDLDYKQYRNGGESLQIYSASNSLVFYDKINDITKPAKRAIDRQQSAIQTSLFDALNKIKPPLEILRMELRLSQKRKLNQVFEELVLNKNPTFKEIFNKEICQKLLLHYWLKFFDDNLFLFGATNNPQKYLQAILAKYPRIGIDKAIKITSFLMLCKDEAGMQGFRLVAQNYRPKTNWTKLKNWLDNLVDITDLFPLHGFIGDIQRELKEFKPYRVKSP